MFFCIKSTILIDIFVGGEFLNMFIKVQDENNYYTVINSDDIKSAQIEITNTYKDGGVDFFINIITNKGKYRSFGVSGEIPSSLKKLETDDLLEVYTVALAYTLNHASTDIYNSIITNIDFVVDSFMYEHGEEYADILGM